LLLEAGLGGEYSVLFSGFARSALTKREGAEKETIIEGEDGGREISLGRSSRSYAKGTPILFVIDDLLTDMGLGRGNLAAVSPLLTGVFSHGTVTDGPAHKELEGILKRKGVMFSVQNGVAQFLQVGKALPTNDPLVLGANTGLVGSPERDANGRVLATALLVKDVYPGQYVILETTAKELQGAYRVWGVEHVGSTFSNDWYHKLELEAGYSVV
jgi:hypothetical protein